MKTIVVQLDKGRFPVAEIKVTATRIEKEKLEVLADWHGVRVEDLLKAALLEGLDNLEAIASGGG